MTPADFTSALFLGMVHPHAALAPWRYLTTGRPSPLGRMPGADRAARQAARLVGAEATIFAPSSLHALVDVLDRRRRGIVVIDAAAYPIGRRAAAGCRIRTVSHYRPASLARALRGVPAEMAATVLLDGFCTGCNKPAPLKEVLRIAATHSAEVVLDDTQGFGLLGPGGGGTASRLETWPDHLIVVTSAAKAFGVPIALICGTRNTVAALRNFGGLRHHGSPVSAADISAFAHAMAQNRAMGDTLRSRLWRLVHQFRALLRRSGIATLGGHFPVVTIPVDCRDTVLHLQRRLASRGINALARRLCWNGLLGLSFILTASHTGASVARAAQAMRQILEESHDLQPGNALA